MGLKVRLSNKLIPCDTANTLLTNLATSARMLKGSIRVVSIALFYFVLVFLAMVVTALAFAHGWFYALGFLALIWTFYLLCQVFQWKPAGNIGLASFIGFATGLLRESDRITSDMPVQIISWLPQKWLGTIGLAFYFPFLAFLPWLASRLALTLHQSKATANKQPHP